MRLLLFLLLALCVDAAGQKVFTTQRRGQNIHRFGIGAQVFEPTGINLQIFRGQFSSNNAAYSTYGVVELGLGLENEIKVIDEKTYAGGIWTEGGLRVDLNYLYPLITVHAPVAIQTYVGAGLQSGSRKYLVNNTVESEFATGANFLLRLEVGFHGFEIGPSMWFVSVYGDARIHADFTEDFSYFAPSLGLRMRKGR
jgi:hypothetical protein